LSLSVGKNPKPTFANPFAVSQGLLYQGTTAESRFAKTKLHLSLIDLSEGASSNCSLRGSLCLLYRKHPASL
jgi:hypothetical protein